MNCEQAYDELGQLGVEVIPVHFKSRTALIGPDGFLSLDYGKIETQEKELAILLEEIGHFKTGSYYSVASPYALRQQQEDRAARYVYETYYPPQTILSAMRACGPEPWNLAEYFGLPESAVRQMLQYYTEVQNVSFSELIAAPAEPAPEIPRRREEGTQPPKMRHTAPGERQGPTGKTPPPKAAAGGKQKSRAPAQRENAQENKAPATAAPYGTKEYWRRQRLSLLRASLTNVCR